MCNRAISFFLNQGRVSVSSSFRIVHDMKRVGIEFLPFIIYMVLGAVKTASICSAFII